MAVVVVAVVAAAAAAAVAAGRGGVRHREADGVHCSRKRRSTQHLTVIRNLMEVEPLQFETSLI